MFFIKKLLYLQKDTQTEILLFKNKYTWKIKMLA